MQVGMGNTHVCPDSTQQGTITMAISEQSL